MSKIKFNLEEKIILVTVLVKSKYSEKQLRMVLDTGATCTLISRKAAELLGLFPRLSQHHRVVSITGAGRPMLVKIDCVEVDNRKVKYIDAIVKDLPPQSGADGLIGLDFLKNFNLFINFKNSYFELTSS